MSTTDKVFMKKLILYVLYTSYYIFLIIQWKQLREIKF